MLRLVYMGDLHIRGSNPRNRLDDYKEVLKAKLREVFQLAKENRAEAILCAGDIFDRPEVSIGVLLEFADLFAESPVPIYTTPGNHDIYGYNLATYWRTSLALLERLVPHFHVIKAPDVPVLFGKVAVSFTPYSGEMDKDGYGYSPTYEGLQDYFKIHISHGMLLDHEPPFDRFTLVQDVQTTADLVLTGHDHIGYGIYERPDGKTFVNCGSLTRLAASTGELQRTIQVLLVDIRTDIRATAGEPIEYDYNMNLKLVQLQSAKPGAEILDRSKIEAEQKRQYAMEQFSALIQSNSGEVVRLDINGIVEQIAKQEEFAPDVVAVALEKITQAQENL